MLNAAAGAHALNLAGANGGAGAKTVFMRERTFQHIGDDFHIPVRMSGKAALGRDVIFVDHAQAAETHMGRIVIIGEGKAEMTIEPIGAALSAFVGWSECKGLS